MGTVNNSINDSDETLKKNTFFQFIQEEKEKKIEIERARLWHLFDFIPDKYIKSFNIVVFEIIATLFFAIIYYILLCDFDRHFFLVSGYPKRHFTHHKFLTALFLSISLQSTTSYLSINFKSILVKCIINLQLIITIAILFFFVSN